MSSLPTTGAGAVEPAYAIRFDYDKAQAHPMRTDKNGKPIWYGYSLRPTDADGDPIPLTGIVLHSTEGAVGEPWPAALAYIRDSPDVSAHYYVARSGEIQRILDPGPYRAWHAGVSSYHGLTDWNNFAVGIELHHAHGEAPYPAVQLGALRWLCRQLMYDHPTIVKEQIVLHRWIAVDATGHTGRKIDPTDLDDAYWQQWIAVL